MRLFFLVLKLNFEVGGGSTYELDKKVRALIGKGHEVTIITVFSKQNQLVNNLPYKIIEEQVGDLHLWSIQKFTYQVLKKYENQADLFCVEGQFSYGSGFYCFWGGKNPVEVHFNRELSSFPESTRKIVEQPPLLLKNKMRFIFERFFCFPLINFNDLLTFTSPLLQNLYIKYGVKRKKTLVVPDFFDSQDLQKNINKLDILKLRNEQKQKWTIICGGRMVREKGFDIIIKAFKNLKQPEKFELIITGSGSEEKSLKQLARDLKIDTQVIFPGWLSKEKTYKLFRKADIFVIPRWRPELTSMLALEVMAFLIPYIVTKNTAISWQAKDSALTFEDEDFIDLAKQIETLVFSPTLRIKLINSGIDRLRELDGDAIINNFNDRLLELVK